MDTQSVSELISQGFALLSSHAWIPLAALVIAFLARLTKDDNVFPINVPARARVWVVFALGTASGILQAITTGTAWPQAVGGGVLSALLAIFGHQGLIESLRNGKEFALPGLMKSTETTAVAAGSAELKAEGALTQVAKGASLIVLMLSLGALLANCSWLQKHPPSQIVDTVVDCTKSVCDQQPTAGACAELRGQVTACVTGLACGLPSTCFDLISVPGVTITFQDIACIWKELAAAKAGAGPNPVADQAQRLILERNIKFAEPYGKAPKALPASTVRTEQHLYGAVVYDSTGPTSTATTITTDPHYHAGPVGNWGDFVWPAVDGGAR